MIKDLIMADDYFIKHPSTQNPEEVHGLHIEDVHDFPATGLKLGLYFWNFWWHPKNFYYDQNIISSDH